MRHATHMTESCHMSHATLMTESCHISHATLMTESCHISHATLMTESCNISHATLMTESCHMSHATLMTESCHISHATLMTESCHMSHRAPSCTRSCGRHACYTRAWVMSHTHMSVVTHTNEPQHICAHALLSRVVKEKETASLTSLLGSWFTESLVSRVVKNTTD